MRIEFYLRPTDELMSVIRENRGVYSTSRVVERGDELKLELSEKLGKIEVGRTPLSDIFDEATVFLYDRSLIADVVVIDLEDPRQVDVLKVGEEPGWDRMDYFDLDKVVFYKPASQAA